MSTFMLYLLLILPSVKAAFTVITAVFLGVAVGFGCVSSLIFVDARDGNVKIKDIWTKLKHPIIWLAVGLGALAFIPTLPIIFALIGWELAGSDAFASFADLPPKFVEYMNALLDRELGKLIPAPQ